MDWGLIAQFGSAVVALVSCLVTYGNNINNNKTIRKLELTKQQFAQENERLKRNQAIQDYKNNIIASFLGDLSACLNQFDIDNLKKAQESAGKAFPLCTSKEKELVKDTLLKIARAGEAYSSQKVWNSANNAILKTLSTFKYDLRQKL